MKFFLKLAVLLLVVGGGGTALVSWGRAYWNDRNKPNFRSGKVTRGDVVLMVLSTGTVQPEKRVSIGSVVSGPIKKLCVDYNSVVKKGEVLAEIDPRIYEANVNRDEALCASAKADVERVKAQLEQAHNDEARAIELQKKNKRYISDTEMDKFRFSRLCLEAQLGVSQASVKQAQGNLGTSRMYLEYTQIVSPVDGVVIDRKIDEGQTLAANFQTPEMFVVAPNMDKTMYVYASVDEADIGLIRDAQQDDKPAVFTVDAYLDDLFEGKIFQIRVNPTTTQNVVTYTVVVKAPNPEQKLLPGMTANLTFEIDKHAHVLKVPNAALRFFPKRELVRPEDQDVLEGIDNQSASKENTAAEGQQSAQERALSRRNRNKRHVWIAENDLLRALEIVTGINDTKDTEVISGELTEGQEVVTGVKLITAGK
jgi:HlyD family secretion protein